MSGKGGASVFAVDDMVTWSETISEKYFLELFMKEHGPGPFRVAEVVPKTSSFGCGVPDRLHKEFCSYALQGKASYCRPAFHQQQLILEQDGRPVGQNALKTGPQHWNGYWLQKVAA